MRIRDVERRWCRRESAFKDVCPTAPGTQPSWVRFAKNHRARIVASNGSDGRIACDAGTHRIAGSPYMACQERDTVIVLRHYEVTCSGCRENLTTTVHTIGPTPRRQCVRNQTSCLRVKERTIDLIKATPSRGTAGQTAGSDGYRIRPACHRQLNCHHCADTTCLPCC